uniref:Cytidyltransferase-like domain-containing protein n=1 Tax=uncultured bacterium A1Q1_fos_568 TaxID=1256586 RepID=L7VV69_9BACT|nr:hypothetical protein [uncultured bacterium A1Q1_fos_568]
MAIGVYPGSFDPLTIAHLGIARAAVAQLELERVDLALSHRTLGKARLDPSGVERRLDTLREQLDGFPDLGVVVVRAELIVDVAYGYDVVVMGADKWVQVNDPVWYGGDPAARDHAVSALPRVAVAPRSGLSVPPGLLLSVPAELADVSSTAVRAGRTEWAVEPPRS